MKFKLFDDIEEFYSLVYPFLIENEAENILLFSILNSLREDFHKYGKEAPLLGMILQKNQVIMVCLRTTPYNLVISYTQNLDTIKFLVKELTKRDIILPGILGFKNGADLFATLWMEHKNIQASLVMDERNYKLTSVNEDTLGTNTFMLAKEIHRDLIIDWAKNFLYEAFQEERNQDIINNHINIIQDDIPNRRIYLLFHNEEPVCMARKAGKTPNGQLINYVYTPPHLRRNGYATECVAKLSKHLLEEENNKFCFLFTDLANPTSNSIYMKIGYKPIIDFHQYEFSED
ncbi:MAG: GNAT family N-acetyltransferase [Promethearchaeota archaeon]|nr:MAG: GNAT family N-acetyltransferase [Candidatus Lokiarchaeota archaeon]